MPRPRFYQTRSGKDVPAATGRMRKRGGVDPTTCNVSYTPDDLEFLKAIEQYKRDNNRPFPTWKEILEIARCLGYRKVADPAPLPGARGAGE